MSFLVLFIVRNLSLSLRFSHRAQTPDFSRLLERTVFLPLCHFDTFTHFSAVEERGYQSILLHCLPASESMEIESAPASTTMAASALAFMQYILNLNDAIDCELIYRE